jgi:hypothetical protein
VNVGTGFSPVRLISPERLRKTGRDKPGPYGVVTPDYFRPEIFLLFLRGFISVIDDV